MRDEDIPGLMMYINDETVMDTPANRKAYRFVFAFCRNFSEEMGQDMAMIQCWSTVLKRRVAYAAFVLRDGDGDVSGMVPLMMVHQTETQGALGLICAVDCEQIAAGDDCLMFREVAPGDDAKDEEKGCDCGHDQEPAKPATIHTMGTEEVNEAFMHSVQGWTDVPSFEALSEFYNLPTNGEGYEQHPHP